MTNTSNQDVKFLLTPYDADALASLCGQLNAHLKLIESRLKVSIHNRSNEFQVTGPTELVEPVATLLKQLYSDALNGHALTPESVHLHLQQSGIEQRVAAQTDNTSGVEVDVVIRTRKVQIKPRGPNQQGYIRSVWAHDINFGIGPAGTGKTYLAVACAVESLLRDEVERILLVRPAVEAGERLGFLPGDLAQKVDPYLRPLYDALHEMLGFETVAKLQERGVIEIAPLAYMRGRTLNASYIILDESQNTTREQMKMFLTRIGFGSTAVITGDCSQIDLPKGVSSGLIHAQEVLQSVEEISFTNFASRDVVRHPVVQTIVDAYDLHESKS